MSQGGDEKGEGGYEDEDEQQLVYGMPSGTFIVYFYCFVRSSGGGVWCSLLVFLTGVPCQFLYPCIRLIECTLFLGRLSSPSCTNHSATHFFTL